MNRLVNIAICLFLLMFGSVGYSAESGKWVIPAGNEKFIGDSFDSGEASQIFKTDAIRVEGERIAVTISKPDGSETNTVYLAYLHPGVKSDDCRDFFGLWLCVEGASFENPLPAAYLTWLDSVKVDTERLKTLFKKEKNEDLKSRKLSFWQSMHSYVTERRGFILRQFYIFWLSLLFIVLALSFNTEVRHFIRHKSWSISAIVRLLLLLVMILLTGVAAIYMTGVEFVSMC